VLSSAAAWAGVRRTRRGGAAGAGSGFMGSLRGISESGFWLAGAGCGDGSLAGVVERSAGARVGVGSVGGGLVPRLGTGNAPGSGFMGSLRGIAESGFLPVAGFMGSIPGTVESGFWPVMAGCAGWPVKRARRPALR